jgi:hypothetical protein
MRGMPVISCESKSSGSLTVLSRRLAAPAGRTTTPPTPMPRLSIGRIYQPRWKFSRPESLEITQFRCKHPINKSDVFLAREGA